MTVRRLGGSERKSEQSSGSGVAHAVFGSSNLDFCWPGKFCLPDALLISLHTKTQQSKAKPIWLWRLILLKI